MKNDLKINIYNKKKLLLNLENQNIYNNKEFELLSNYNELIDCLNELDLDNKAIFKFIYYFKENIHSVLYESEEMIKVDSFKTKNDLSNLFYLCLLIEEQPGIINYYFSFNFIKDIDYKFKQDLVNKKSLTSIIQSKIILILINNYTGLDEYDEENDNQILTSIKNSYIEQINNNLDFCKEINLNLKFSDIIGRLLNNIYKEIIISVINQGKFENYEYISDIIKQLDLENINSTQIMYNELIEVLNIKNNNYINQYSISKKEELFEEKNINFYYFLLKYILKNPIYIYQIQILLQLKKFILNIIKENDLSYNHLDNGSKIRLKYVIETLLDSKYYINIEKIPKLDLLQLKVVLEYYKEYCFESKKKVIEIIENIIKDNKGEYKKYLTEYKFAKKMNERLPIINYYFTMEKNIKKENVSEEEFIKFGKNWETLEDGIKKKKIKKFRKTDKIILYKYFNDINNRKILLNIFDEENINFFIEQCKNILDKNQNKKINQDKKLTLPPTNIKEKNNIDIQEGNINEKNINDIQDKDSQSFNSTVAYTKSNINNKPIEISKKSYNLINFKGNDCPPPLPLDNKNIDDLILDKILTKSTFKLHINENKILYMDEINFGDNEMKISKEQFELNFGQFQNKKNLNLLYKNAKKFYKFIKEFCNRLLKEFKNNYILKIFLFFKNEFQNNYDDILNISCKYIFFEPISNNPLEFCDNNILIYRTNAITLGFEFLIIEINKECYKDIKNNIFIVDNFKEFINENIYMNSYMVISEINKTTDSEKILEIIKIIENSGKYNGFIKELSSGYYITISSDYSLNLYDMYFNLIMDIQNIKEPIFNIIEKNIYNEIDEDIDQTNNIYLMSCMGNNTYLITIDLNQKDYIRNVQKLPDKNNGFLTCLEINKSNFIATGLNGIYNYTNFFVNNSFIYNTSTKKHKISSEIYFNIFNIDNTILAFVSNSILPGGKDKIIFYDMISLKIISSISGFSFNITPNGLTLMKKTIETDVLQPKEQKKKKKKKKRVQSTQNILLCACKKYNKIQKNGILLINFELNNIKIKYFFIDLDTFEVNCFCPINLINNKNINNYQNKNNYIINDEYKKNINIIETDYFLVGGFDTEKTIGEIRLYKLIYDEKLLKFNIEYLQNIEFLENDKYDVFDSSINCIIQSKLSGNIIISCYDGKIYLSTPPNINYYLENDNKVII